MGHTAHAMGSVPLDLRPMSLSEALQDPELHAAVAADAVAEAEAAVAARTGLRGVTAQLGLATINQLRPGFLERHVHAMLPDMAKAIEPYWRAGVSEGDPTRHLEANANDVTAALLAVTDDYVEQASDAKAIGVYHQLRPRAPRRIAEQMPRIAGFVERHTPPGDSA